MGGRCAGLVGVCSARGGGFVHGVVCREAWLGCDGWVLQVCAHGRAWSTLDGFAENLACKQAGRMHRSVVLVVVSLLSVDAACTVRMAGLKCLGSISLPLTRPHSPTLTPLPCPHDGLAALPLSFSHYLSLSLSHANVRAHTRQAGGAQGVCLFSHSLSISHTHLLTLPHPYLTLLYRLAALKEFAFMRALGDHGFPVPQAIDCNRHAVLMTLLDACPMVQVKKLKHPGQVGLSHFWLCFACFISCFLFPDGIHSRAGLGLRCLGLPSTGSVDVMHSSPGGAALPCSGAGAFVQLEQLTFI